VAIGAQANDAYIMDQLVADLSRIKRPDFWSDVSVVDLPDYPEDNLASCLEGDTPAIHLWIQEDMQTSSRENSADFRPTMRVLTMGVAKVPRGLQLAMIELKNDIRNVMLSNWARNWPGSTDPNTHGIYTRQAAKPTLYFFHEGTASERIGTVVSWWDIDYRAPYPKG
jgi:hypothetical protein